MHLSQRAKASKCNLLQPSIVKLQDQTDSYAYKQKTKLQRVT